MNTQVLEETLTLERVAAEGIEVGFDDVKGFPTPLGMHVPVQVCHHPRLTLVMPDMVVALDVELNAPGLGLALGTPSNLPKYPDVTRKLHQGYYPIMESSWESNGVRLSQTVLSVLPHDEKVVTGLETQHVVIRLTLTNTETSRQQLPLFVYLGDMGDSHHTNYSWYKAPIVRWAGPVRKLSMDGQAVLEDDRVVLTYRSEAPATLVSQIESGCTGEDEPETFTNAIRFDLDLAAGETQVIDIVAAGNAAFHPAEELGSMAKVEFDKALQWSIARWDEILAPAMKFTTPEQPINDRYKYLIFSTLAMQIRDPERGWHEPRQWPMYWVWSWEFAHTVVPMMAIGLQKEFDLSFRYFIERQNGIGPHSANAIPQGDVSSAKGSYVGYSGEHQFLWMNETGSILWAMGERYLYSRDAEWLKSVMPSALAAWDWVQTERQQTRIFDEDGNKVRYYGLLPAGMPGDIHEKYYQFTFSDNFTWYGMNQLAAAARDAGLPEAERLTQEADEYRQCIMDIIEREQYVDPETGLLFVPNMVFYRESENPDPFWYADGPVQLYDTGLLDPRDERFPQMVEYTRLKYGILMGMAEHYEGGVEWYPNQTERSYFKSYLKRGEYEKAMLVLYCNLTYGMSGDTYQTSERFHTDSENFCAYAPNASGNGRNIELMRRMVIDEQDAGKLWLLRGCPRRWFTDGQSITIENATTLFGKMAIRTRVEGKTITIEVESPDRETPEEMILVVRVPQGTAIADATLDGVPTSFDGDQIVLPKRHGQFTVKVRYADR